MQNYHFVTFMKELFTTVHESQVNRGVVSNVLVSCGLFATTPRFTFCSGETDRDFYIKA